MSQQTLIINIYYENTSFVMHIHSICNGFNGGKIIVAAGDSAKNLDLWIIKMTTSVLLNIYINHLRDMLKCLGRRQALSIFDV